MFAIFYLFYVSHPWGALFKYLSDHLDCDHKKYVDPRLSTLYTLLNERGLQIERYTTQDPKIKAQQGGRREKERHENHRVCSIHIAFLPNRVVDRRRTIHTPNSQISLRSRFESKKGKRLPKGRIGDLIVRQVNVLDAQVNLALIHSPKRDREGVGSVGVDNSSRNREDLLRPNVLDILAELVAVHVDLSSDCPFSDITTKHDVDGDVDLIGNIQIKSYGRKSTVNRQHRRRQDEQDQDA